MHVLHDLLVQQPHLHESEGKCSITTTKDIPGNATLDTFTGESEEDRAAVESRLSSLPLLHSLPAPLSGTFLPNSEIVNVHLSAAIRENELTSRTTESNLVEHRTTNRSEPNKKYCEDTQRQPGEVGKRNIPKSLSIESCCEDNLEVGIPANHAKTRTFSDDEAGLAQANLCGSVPNIYGSGDNSGVGFIGSWKILSNSTNMASYELMRDEESTLPCSMAKPGKSSHRDNATAITGGTGNRWQFAAGTSLEIRSSHLLKLVCMLILVIAVISVVFHSRIRVLEQQKMVLQHDLSVVKLHLEILIERMDTVANLAIPTKSSNVYAQENDRVKEMSSGNLYDAGSSAEEAEAKQEVVRSLVKRSAPGRATKELQYPTSPISFNSLSNDSTMGSSAMIDDWSTGIGENARFPKGNKNERIGKNLAHRKYLQRLLRKEIKQLKDAHHLQIAKLNRKLSRSRQRLRTSANLSCCNESSSQHNLSVVHSTASTYGNKNTRAAYFQIDGTNVNIRKPKQLIGPWFLPEDGRAIGFNGLWYDNIELDSNGTSVVFQEDGLFLIYSQVFYQQQYSHSTKPSPMGYRIYLKKNGNGGSNSHAFRRPMPIAECVPSFPTTVYQTCFTQVAWFVEAQDEIYLEHFMDSLPMIEALRNGQTFLGIVRL